MWILKNAGDFVNLKIPSYQSNFDFHSRKSNNYENNKFFFPMYQRIKLFVAIFGIYLYCFINITNGVGAASAATTSSWKLKPSFQQQQTTECPKATDPLCLKCNLDGCVKCPNLLVIDSKRCIDRCPSGYINQWSTDPDYMGRVCHATGFSGSTSAAISGLIVGCIICLTLLIAAIIVMKRKKRQIPHMENKLILETHCTVGENGSIIDTTRLQKDEHQRIKKAGSSTTRLIDHSDFLQQLDEIRPNAEYLLAMLNDARRRIRKLYLSGEIDAINSYRPYVRDLAKVLILLNRPIESLQEPPPHDWDHIYAWIEHALNRYKRQVVNQVVDFFQLQELQQQQQLLDKDNDPRFDLYSSTCKSPQQSTFRTFTPSRLTTTRVAGNESSHVIENSNNIFPLGEGDIMNRVDDNSIINSNNKVKRKRKQQQQQEHLKEQRRQISSILDNQSKSEEMFGGSLISLHEFNESRTSSDPFSNNFNAPKGNLISMDLNASSLWLEDEFFKLGFRPQDEITTEL